MMMALNLNPMATVVLSLNPMFKVNLNLPMLDVARSRLEYHRSLFWAIGRPQKAGIGHVGVVGHEKAIDQVGHGHGCPCGQHHHRHDQGRSRVPQVHLLGQWDGLED